MSPRPLVRVVKHGEETLDLTVRKDDISSSTELNGALYL